MRKLLFILPIVFLFACKKEQFRITGVTGPSGVSIYFKNAAGQDLLNSSTPNALDPFQIQLLDINAAGQKTVYFKGHLDSPKGFNLYKDDLGANYMTLTYGGGFKIGNKITRYLKFEDGSEDKITFEVALGELIVNVWVNDILLATKVSGSPLGVINIVK